MTQPLFLVGARGCGKTTVGQALARTLGYEFVDTDSFLLTSTGKSVAEIVAEEGWPGFRARESEALQQVTAPATVVATGGGMVLAENNRQFMQENGIAIWLHAPAQILASRLNASPEEGQRPTLTGKGVTDEIVDVLAAREGLYREVAYHIVDATRTPDAVVEAILNALQMARAS
ncbi:Shikimate kinase 2 [Cedecea davisae]|uniref:Shikimate kinase 2 n=1 Tax=Cedecea davisae DSM 4568 TaxID=566551 RepID=S3JFV5_9ENTR|nr:shikimate kinase AroL [Cedecea davisae]EPF19072.1 shikimate kinase [Cedecea davisae DSM 4568]SUX29266.1 Shikimate kinase 2 [Cedecea davisae]